MRINKNQISFYVLAVGIFLAVSFYAYTFHRKFVDSNAFMAFVTFVVGGLAIFLYLKQKKDRKRDAARIILQEIRRAEDIIADYRDRKGYKFEKKIIATNSWAKNIHHFVGDLDVDELDKISDLYSKGEYLDSIVAKVSDENFDSNVQIYKKELESIKNSVQSTFPGQMSSVESILPQQIIPVGKPFEIRVSPPWQSLLDEISLNHQPIYYSRIAQKLQELAEKTNWFPF